MRKFILKIALYTVLVTALFFTFLTFYLKKFEPYIDSNYARLTSYHNGGMVIGTSRAAIDVEPSLINKDLYNFSFTIDASPFDDSYFELIKRYHQTQAFDSTRIHIVTVDPWALSSVMSYENLKNKGFTSQLRMPISNPNHEYILRFANLSVWEINNVIMNSDRNLHINACGRLVKPMTEEFLNKDFKRKLGVKVNNYLNNDVYKHGQISPGKIKNLNAIIDFLEKDGKVYLIRLPIRNEMLQLEDTLCPDFNRIMTELAFKQAIPYINLMVYNQKFRTTDGHHLWEGEIVEFNYLLKQVLSENKY